MINKYMERVNQLATQANEIGEIPIACVITYHDQIIAEGINHREVDNVIHGHAEICAINKAAKNLGSWKLNECEMYISTEPCLMCYGAILQSRIKKVYVGSKQDENKTVSFKNYIDDDQIIDYTYLNDTSSQLIKDFFANKRR